MYNIKYMVTILQKIKEKGEGEHLKIVKILNITLHFNFDVISILVVL